LELFSSTARVSVFPQHQDLEERNSLHIVHTNVRQVIQCEIRKQSSQLTGILLSAYRATHKQHAMGLVLNQLLIHNI
jgi:hypothetical protein